MPSNVAKAIFIGATIFFSIVLVVIVANLVSGGQDSARVGQAKYANLTTQLSDFDYNTYSNNTLSGSQVLNTIRQYMNNDQFGILVQTGKNGYTFYGNRFTISGTNKGEIDNGYGRNTDLSEAENQSSRDYINPSGKFKSSLVRDANNVVRGIIFEQVTN
ncbi:ABC transporter permease [Bacillus sp. FSL K6-6540]|uniref:ABC transporter permease n=1 Tax=Bacillus sp. FSL K6-6540 TaxID=2921512 RepID=UPI0030F9A028